MSTKLHELIGTYVAKPHQPEEESKIAPFQSAFEMSQGINSYGVEVLLQNLLLSVVFQLPDQGSTVFTVKPFWGERVSSGALFIYSSLELILSLLL